MKGKYVLPPTRPRRLLENHSLSITLVTKSAIGSIENVQIPRFRVKSFVHELKGHSAKKANNRCNLPFCMKYTIVEFGNDCEGVTDLIKPEIVPYCEGTCAEDFRGAGRNGQPTSCSESTIDRHVSGFVELR